MRVHSLCQCIFFLSLLLLSIISLSCAVEKTFEVVGIGECADCKENNIKTTQAFTGLGVTIDCKLKNGETRRIGAGNLDKEGKFKVSIPNGELLKEECYAQLHSDAIGPCPAHTGLEASKITFKAQAHGLHTFGPSKNLQFSTACSSKFLWPHFKYPPLSKTHSWKKKFPFYKPKLSPPPLPIYKPKPEPPVYKPKPKPKPESPVYKPPKTKPKPLPPIYKKPLPPPIPPFYKKKPCPPLPKHFNHPKFGYFPPLPPSIPLP